jgi:hypothetical protein
MSEYTEIGMISESLRRFLSTNLSKDYCDPDSLEDNSHTTADSPGGQDQKGDSGTANSSDGEESHNEKWKVTLNSPAVIIPEKYHINLFLYKVVENHTLKNMDWHAKPGFPNQLVPPPLALNLYYLMTAYHGADSPDCDAAVHNILGAAMRVFYENPVIPEKFLEGGLKGAREEIRIILNSLDMEELSKVWATFTTPYRLSVLYEVSVVQLESSAGLERAMAKRVTTIGKPMVRAPYQPPVIESIEPHSGIPGSTVTVHGKKLAGWTPHVTIGSALVPDLPALTGDSFQITMPGELLPGFYEITVDISNLCKQTFYFEVTG